MMQNNLQNSIQTLLTNLVAEGKERGIQVAVYLEGKLVVDAWAGVADVRTGRPVDGDSLFPIFSTTKAIFSTVIHILAQRGQLDYDAPIATYWPAFAANGKAAITMRYVLSHMAGLPYMPDGVNLEQTRDWNFMCRALEQMKPAWAAGTKQVYHPITFGWLIGEVAQRVAGRSVSQLLTDEICRPLGLTRLFCGIPAELEPTTAFLEMVPQPPPILTPPPHDCSPCMHPLFEWINRPETRRAPQPGASGIASARDVARIFAALLPGGVDGVELLSQQQIALATQRHTPMVGEPDPGWARGLGYILGLGEMGKNVMTFGHDGYGGSHGFAAPEHRLAVGLTRNLFTEFKVMTPVAEEIKKALGL